MQIKHIKLTIKENESNNFDRQLNKRFNSVDKLLDYLEQDKTLTNFYDYKMINLATQNDDLKILIDMGNEDENIYIEAWGDCVYPECQDYGEYIDKDDVFKIVDYIYDVINIYDNVHK